MCVGAYGGSSRTPGARAAAGMALGGAALRSTTMLEQLLEEINFQRTKEMRQLLKDGESFLSL